jgi:hypothetical protein
VSFAARAAVVADNANERRTEMGKIVISEFVSLGRVIEDPAGDEGFRLGGWVGEIKGREEADKVKLDEALGTEALLLGRRSYELFAARRSALTRRRPRRNEDHAERKKCLLPGTWKTGLKRTCANRALVETGPISLAWHSRHSRDCPGNCRLNG